MQQSPACLHLLQLKDAVMLAVEQRQQNHIIFAASIRAVGRLLGRLPLRSREGICAEAFVWSLGDGGVVYWISSCYNALCLRSMGTSALTRLAISLAVMLAALATRRRRCGCKCGLLVVPSAWRVARWQETRFRLTARLWVRAMRGQWYFSSRRLSGTMPV